MIECKRVHSKFSRKISGQFKSVNNAAFDDLRRFAV